MEIKTRQGKEVNLSKKSAHDNKSFRDRSISR